jgi:hypothetical protein
MLGEGMVGGRQATAHVATPFPRVPSASRGDSESSEKDGNWRPGRPSPLLPASPGYSWQPIWKRTEVGPVPGAAALQSASFDPL